MGAIQPAVRPVPQTALAERSGGIPEHAEKNRRGPNGGMDPELVAHMAQMGGRAEPLNCRMCMPGDPALD